MIFSWDTSSGLPAYHDSRESGDDLLRSHSLDLRFVDLSEEVEGQREGRQFRDEEGVPQSIKSYIFTQ